MTDKIPTAEEAYEITQRQIVQKSGALFDKVVDAIHRAASNFDTEAVISLQGSERNMVQHLVKTLTATGYVVKVDEMNDPRDGSWTNVHFSWSKK